jgi:Zn-dependent protease with chaperone function
VIPAYWSVGLAAYFWQVALHSTILGLVFYIWARHVRLPSGRTKRRLLAIVLVLPLFTAAMPGRRGLEFRDRVAWFDSGRLLATPLAGGIRLYHVVLIIGVMMVAVTVWQELMPVLRRPQATAGRVPDWLAQLARALPGWDRCEVLISPRCDVLLATSGWPRRPRVIVSAGALNRLDAAQLSAVVAHEHAHWRHGRWLRLYALFAARLIQIANPVSLWAFREYCVEVEVECDAEASAGRDPKLLAGTLFTLYELTDRSDVAARSTLRKRIDILLASGRGVDDHALPAATIVAAAVAMMLVLPWIV